MLLDMMNKGGLSVVLFWLSQGKIDLIDREYISAHNDIKSY